MSKKLCIICLEQARTKDTIMCSDCFAEWEALKGPDMPWIADRARYFERKRQRNTKEKP